MTGIQGGGDGCGGAGSREERGGGSREATELKRSPGRCRVGGERAGEGLLGAASLLSPSAEAALWFCSQRGGREARKDVRGAKQAPGLGTLSSDHRPPLILCASAAPPWEQPPHTADSHEAISVVWHAVTKSPARADPSDVTHHLTNHPPLPLELPAKPQAGLFPQPHSTSKSGKDFLAHSRQIKRVPNFSTGTLLSQEKERINAIDNSMDGLSDDHTKERKPERERQILYHQVCSRNICKATILPIQTHSQTSKTLVAQSRLRLCDPHGL